MTAAKLSADWVPADTALRARMAALSRAATSLGASISATPRRRRKERFEEQARANFAAAYAQAQANDPTYHLTPQQQEREIERMRQALLQRQMLELADRSAWSRGVDKRDKAARAKRREQRRQRNRAGLGRDTDAENPRPTHAIQAETNGHISYGLTNQ